MNIHNGNFKNQEKLERVVRECVDAYDSEGLLKMGCPSDEYDLEIEEIANSLEPDSSPDQIWILICNVLHWYFGDHERPVLYWPKHYELAYSICKRISEIDFVRD